MAVVVKKNAKAKIRRQKAIEAYKEWLAENPKAGRKKRADQFDLYCDTAYFNEKVNGSA
jgi:plasmid stabilization system protein ParE